MSVVSFERRFHVELCYRVLAALDLKRDAASIYSGREARWARGLLEAYQAAPGRLVVQGLPLIVDDLDALLALLGPGRLADLRDAPGKVLAERLRGALESEAEAARARWEEDAGAARCREAALAEWRPDLERLLQPAQGILVHDCPALATREGTHGRSLLWRGRLRIALGLGGPTEQVLCQLVHEAVHAVTDPAIRAAHRGLPHDTRADGGAFELHRRLEEAAVEEGERLVDERAPRLREAYRRWRRRHGY